MTDNKKISAELLLLHAPAYFDFRTEDRVYFPYLSTSGDVPITPVYEYFPLGFKTLHQYLGSRGHDVKIFNLCSYMLMYPDSDIKTLLGNMEAKIFGIDLHWMVHVQGSLEVASLLKKLHPEAVILLGGISATYYADELIRYPFIDMVMSGYDTHQPMASLLSTVKNGGNFETVPNLIWKNKNGEIVDNKITHTPRNYSCFIDWSNIPKSTNTIFPILEILSTQNAGCRFNCGWCGGSASAFKRLYECKHSNAFKELDQVGKEFKTVCKIPDVGKFAYYACGAYNESQDRLDYIFQRIKECGLKSVDFEQYFLPDDHTLKKMADVSPKTIVTLSPESHDIKISKLAGRGVYTMDEMEEWISKALHYGIYEINIWFFIGMPEQDESSVLETVAYCRRLLKRFKGERVIPFICPLIPFLDPASTFFENPKKRGYNIHHRTVEEHRTAMKRASLTNRLNYSTKWLGREELVNVGYKAVRSLFEIKAEFGFFPSSIIESVIAKISDALDFNKIVYRIDCIKDVKERNRELSRISSEIHKRNREVLFSGVSNQAFPLNRSIGGRWIDMLL